MVDLFCICSKTLLLYSLTAADEGPGKRQSRFLQIICCKLYHRVCMCVIPMRLRAEEGPMQRSLTLTPPPAATLGGLSQRTCELWKVPCESSPASAGLELTAPFLRADHLRLSGQDGNTYCVRSYGFAYAVRSVLRIALQLFGQKGKKAHLVHFFIITYLITYPCLFTLTSVYYIWFNSKNA